MTNQPEVERSYPLELVVRLASQLRPELGVDASSDLVALGLDSIELLALAEQLSSQLSLRCDVEDVFEQPTLASLAQTLRGRLDLDVG